MLFGLALKLGCIVEVCMIRNSIPLIALVVEFWYDATP